MDKFLIRLKDKERANVDKSIGEKCQEENIGDSERGVGAAVDEVGLSKEKGKPTRKFKDSWKERTHGYRMTVKGSGCFAAFALLLQIKVCQSQPWQEGLIRSNALLKVALTIGRKLSIPFSLMRSLTFIVPL